MMAVTYRVRNWDTHYETAETRRLKRLRFCLVPNKHDGKGYRRLMSHPKSGDMLAAWLLILQVASKCPERGVLADEDGPLDAEDLSVKTGMKASAFDEAFEVLTDPKIGWLEAINCDHPANPAGRPANPSDHPAIAGCDLSESEHPDNKGVISNPQQSPAKSADHPAIAVQKGREGKGIDQTRHEGNRREGKEDMSSGDDAPALTSTESEIVEAWNSIDGVTHVVAMNPGRKKAIKARLNDRVFRDRWREAIEKVRGSPFCLGENDRNWRATFDWFLRPGTVAKAIEGQYDSRRRNGTTSETIDDYLAQFGGQT